MAVNPSTSDMKIVRSCCVPPSSASTPRAISRRTRSAGTYFWNERRPDFMFSSCCTMPLISMMRERMVGALSRSNCLTFIISASSCDKGRRRRWAMT
ncbi:hypothetical protein Y695_04057 [Hydrogenophaga sp. T4]|nr:hypothetical protein Y695_04057 [Hydrogenophaga sp. T4]